MAWPNAAGFNALQDHRISTKLQVKGSIPSYASGTLYRTGPGGYKVAGSKGDIACSHWFDGYAVVHKFEILDSTSVIYSSYCQVDELLEDVRKTARRQDITFGQKRDPGQGLFQKVKATFIPAPDLKAHSANIGVTIRESMPQELQSLQQKGSPNKVLTLTTDTGQVKQFDADTLEPLSVTSQDILHPSLVGPLSAAHAARDPKTGEIFNYNLELASKATYRIFKASPLSSVEILATVSDVPAAYIHSILLTDNFVILCIWPAHYKLYSLSILWNQTLLDSLKPFNPGAKTMWLVIDRRSGRGVVKRLTSSAIFCLHTVNAWETKSESGGVDIICELSEYDNMDILHRFYYENLISNEKVTRMWHTRRNKMTGGLARYKLSDVPLDSPTTIKTRAEAIKLSRVDFPAGGDLPQINPNYELRQHQYVWTVVDRQRSSFVDGLAKTNMSNGSCITWECEKHTPGEPIFLPKPGSSSEDEGVILSVVLDGGKGVSYLLCLDARTMEELGRAEIGYPVGFGFHGRFLSRD